jgi:hypothetical protein
MAQKDKCIIYGPGCILRGPSATEITFAIVTDLHLQQTNSKANELGTEERGWFVVGFTALSLTIAYTRTHV